MAPILLWAAPMKNGLPVARRLALVAALAPALAATLALGCVDASHDLFSSAPEASAQLIDGEADTVDEATVMVIIQDDIANPRGRAAAPARSSLRTSSSPLRTASRPR